jgi:hypothetical protein
MPLPRRSSQRQLSPLSLPTRQLPCLHPLPRSLARGLRPHRQREETPEEEPSSTSTGVPILTVRALGGAGPNGGRTCQYWPFSSSDLYNWKAQNPPFSEDPRVLTDLFESILHTHSPTWDDCQQLLKTLFTTKERERILTEARKNVPGDNGRTC